MTKNHWRYVLISAAAVAFSTAAGLEPPLRHLIIFAKAGTSFSAKQLCSGVLMAGMDPDRMLSEDLAAGKGLIQTKIDQAGGRVEASALFGLVRAEAVQNDGHGCSQRINGRPIPPATKPSSPCLKGSESNW